MAGDDTKYLPVRKLTYTGVRHLTTQTYGELIKELDYGSLLYVMYDEPPKSGELPLGTLRRIDSRAEFDSAPWGESKLRQFYSIPIAVVRAD